MPRKRILSPAQLETLEATAREQYSAELSALVKSKLFRDLMKPGALFRRWTGAVPANVWVESKSGNILHHNVSGDSNCKVKDALFLLKKVGALDEIRDYPGED